MTNLDTNNNGLDKGVKPIKGETSDYISDFTCAVAVIVMEDGVDLDARELAHIGGITKESINGISTIEKLDNFGSELRGLEENGLRFVGVPNTINGLSEEISDDMEMKDIYFKESNIVKKHVNRIIQAFNNTGVDAFSVGGITGKTGYFREEYSLDNDKSYYEEIINSSGKGKFPIVSPLINGDQLIDSISFTKELSVALEANKIIIPTNELNFLLDFSMISFDFTKIIVDYQYIDNTAKQEKLKLILKDTDTEDLLDILSLDQLIKLLDRIKLSPLGIKYLSSAIDFIESNSGNRVHFIRTAKDITEEILNIDGALDSLMISDKNATSIGSENGKYSKYYVLRH